MTSVVLSEAADADLAAILDYGVERFGAETGEAYVAGFKASFDLIAEHPLAGAVHGEIRPPIRSLPHGSHRIFYDVLGTEWSSSASFTKRWMWSGIYRS